MGFLLFFGMSWVSWVSWDLSISDVVWEIWWVGDFLEFWVVCQVVFGDDVNILILDNE